ncbi:hypothetical protein FTX61_01490 [Nitriliruptoraceae bacterium ZYF776]|nr:hypothetical protein [Profundirhabdus halotolerans]
MRDPRPSEIAMFSLRNLGGVALLLFGSTFVWLTPEFASRGVSTASAWWAATRVFALLAVLGFTVATVGLFRRDGWWIGVAVGSAVVGIVAAIAFLAAAVPAGETTPWFTAAISVLGSVAVLVLLLVPALQRFVQGHVMSG